MAKHTQHTHTHLGVVRLEVSLLSASPLFILSLLQLLALLLSTALIGSEAAGRVGLDVGLVLQGSSGGKDKKRTDTVYLIILV